MSKKPRRAGSNGHARQQRSAVETSAQLLSLPVADRPLRMAPTGKMRLATPTDPAQPMLLVFDATEEVWRIVLLPPGARWVIQAEGSPAKPGLWSPGQPK